MGDNARLSASPQSYRHVWSEAILKMPAQSRQARKPIHEVHRVERQTRCSQDGKLVA